MCIFLIHAGQLPTVFCGRLQPYRLQEKGVAFGSAGSPCFLPCTVRVEEVCVAVGFQNAYITHFRLALLRAGEVDRAPAATHLHLAVLVCWLSFFRILGCDLQMVCFFFCKY